MDILDLKTQLEKVDPEKISAEGKKFYNLLKEFSNCFIENNKIITFEDFKNHLKLSAKENKLSKDFEQYLNSSAHNNDPFHQFLKTWQLIDTLITYDGTAKDINSGSLDNIPASIVGEPSNFQIQIKDSTTATLINPKHRLHAGIHRPAVEAVTFSDDRNLIYCIYSFISEFLLLGQQTTKFFILVANRQGKILQQWQLNKVTGTGCNLIPQPSGHVLFTGPADGKHILDLINPYTGQSEIFPPQELSNEHFYFRQVSPTIIPPLPQVMANWNQVLNLLLQSYGALPTVIAQLIMGYVTCISVPVPSSSSNQNNVASGIQQSSQNPLHEIKDDNSSKNNLKTATTNKTEKQVIPFQSDKRTSLSTTPLRSSQLSSTSTHDPVTDSKGTTLSTTTTGFNSTPLSLTPRTSGFNLSTVFNNLFSNNKADSNPPPPPSSSSLRNTPP